MFLSLFGRSSTVYSGLPLVERDSEQVIVTLADVTVFDIANAGPCTDCFIVIDVSVYIPFENPMLTVNTVVTYGSFQVEVRVVVTLHQYSTMAIYFCRLSSSSRRMTM